MAKTSRFGRLEAAAAAEPYGTPAYHRAIALMHASPDNPEGGGRCGCYSCAFAKRRRAA